MVHTTEFRRRTPEKWKRVWEQVYSDKYKLVLLEPLITEIYYQIVSLCGKIDAQCYLLKLKGIKNTDIIPHNKMDGVAFLAGDIIMKYKRHKISLVDSYIIAAAIKEKASIYTTDHGVRDSAKQEKCVVDYLPKESL
jgi:predicted nucleic acid-binding protein